MAVVDVRGCSLGDLTDPEVVKDAQHDMDRALCLVGDFRKVALAAWAEKWGLALLDRGHETYDMEEVAEESAEEAEAVKTAAEAEHDTVQSELDEILEAVRKFVAWAATQTKMSDAGKAQVLKLEEALDTDD